MLRSPVPTQARWVQSMRVLIGPVLGLAAVLVVAGGCERRIPKEDLGNVVFEVPKVPGWDTPPEVPDLDSAAAPKAASPR